MRHQLQPARGVVTQATHLNAKITPVHVVAEEEVSSIRRIATYFEKLHKIEILAVYITTNGDGGVHFQKIGFAFQYLCTRLDDEQRLLFGKAAFAVKVLFEELKIRLGAIMRRKELVLGRRLEGWCLNICRYTSQ